mmetsp:Transcript_18860/g.36624  ORF Transcript_18860/g.36624 Transcript_18860/m.36624 type:complete len:93 (-) Transcript_18860:613-891(-)
MARCQNKDGKTKSQCRCKNNDCGLDQAEELCQPDIYYVSGFNQCASSRCPNCPSSCAGTSLRGLASSIVKICLAFKHGAATADQAKIRLLAQ